MQEQSNWQHTGIICYTCSPMLRTSVWILHQYGWYCQYQNVSTYIFDQYWPNDVCYQGRVTPRTFFTCPTSFGCHRLEGVTRAVPPHPLLTPLGAAGSSWSRTVWPTDFQANLLQQQIILEVGWPHRKFRGKTKHTSRRPGESSSNELDIVRFKKLYSFSVKKCDFHRQMPVERNERLQMYLVLPPGE